MFNQTTDIKKRCVTVPLMLKQGLKCNRTQMLKCGLNVQPNYRHLKCDFDVQPNHTPKKCRLDVQPNRRY